MFTVEWGVNLDVGQAARFRRGTAPQTQDFEIHPKLWTFPLQRTLDRD